MTGGRPIASPTEQRSALRIPADRVTQRPDPFGSGARDEELLVDAILQPSITQETRGGAG